MQPHYLGLGAKWLTVGYSLIKIFQESECLKKVTMLPSEDLFLIVNILSLRKQTLCV